MLQIDVMALGAYQTNCYLVSAPGSDRCLIIDPGYEANAIKTRLRQRELTPDAILLPHGHIDHVGAVRERAMDFDCRVFLCPEDLSMPPMMTAGPLFYTDTYGEGDCLTLAGLPFRVFHTPGHTPGSVCLLLGDQMFSGDTLFEGSCGRMDLPGGDQLQMHQSLNRLVSLQADYHIHPGHGGSTTLAAEKRYNPYMR